MQWNLIVVNKDWISDLKKLLIFLNNFTIILKCPITDIGVYSVFFNTLLKLFFYF